MTRRAVAAALVAALAVTACSHDSKAALPSTTTSTTVHYTGDAKSPFCDLLRQDNTADVVGDKGTPTSVEAGFTKLRQVLAATVAQAPPELVTDVSLIATGIAALDDALRAVGYDYNALASSPDALTVSAAVNDPSFTTAGDHVTAYKTQVCHL